MDDTTFFWVIVPAVIIVGIAASAIVWAVRGKPADLHVDNADNAAPDSSPGAEQRPNTDW